MSCEMSLGYVRRSKSIMPGIAALDKSFAGLLDGVANSTPILVLFACVRPRFSHSTLDSPTSLPEVEHGSLRLPVSSQDAEEARPAPSEACFGIFQTGFHFLACITSKVAPMRRGVVPCPTSELPGLSSPCFHHHHQVTFL